MENQTPPQPAPSAQLKKSFPTWAIVLIIILIIFLGGGFLIYWKFWGITKKQKYEKCAKTCEDIMLLESDIPMCKQKCIQITGFSPSPTPTPQKTATPGKTITPTSQKSSTSSNVYANIELTCNYVWPQQIVEKGTQTLVLICPGVRPWCRPGNGTYQDISCCKDYSEATKEKTDCVKLPDLLK